MSIRSEKFSTKVVIRTDYKFLIEEKPLEVNFPKWHL